MLICGIKVTHDGAVAVLEDNRLLFSVEIEKIGNGERYSSLGDLHLVARILESEGLTTSEIDQFVVDGWFAADGREIDASPAPSVLTTRAGHAERLLRVAPYQDRAGAGDPLTRHMFPDFDFTGRADGYASYHHVSNHIMGAYCSSPFAARGENALVMVWDGGMVARVYRVDPAGPAVSSVATLLPLTGNSFGDFSAQFPPFHRNTDGFDADQIMRHHLSIAGKAMAYAALGRVEPSAFSTFDDILAAFPNVSPENAKAVGGKVLSNRDSLFAGMSDADLIASFQAYLGQRVLDRMASLVRRRLPGQRLGAVLGRGDSYRPNLVLAGGCALNIKWNSLLRASGLFADIWIPPFPNDSGAAIGTAACEMFRTGGRISLNWNVYSGPAITIGELPPGWRRRPCDEVELATLMHEEDEPVVVLSGRAEIGPRALGNRSILAPATSTDMKDRLNVLKDRAGYRPVAPICLESRAAEVFAPGGADPYMLFEHRPRPGWAERIPAVLHLDGTARLQTIDVTSGTACARILTAYERISGIPVLCNTSANLNGSGFFPDVASAARWGGTRYIWSSGELFINPVSSGVNS